MKLIKILFYLFLVVILTVFTQVGGIVLLITLLFFPKINRIHPKGGINTYLKIGTFILFYLVTTFTIVPFIAQMFGRVQLPIYEKNNIKPLNRLTCLLNRNYVRPELKKSLEETAAMMNAKYPGTTVNYLDANFPFINSFPLLPHLSHNDGRKVDLAFYYTDVNNLKTNESPSWIGYGICEEPKEGEENKPEFCDKKGYWQYSLLKKLVPQENKKNYLFDKERTKALLEIIDYNPSIHKIFLEPHLVQRLDLKSSKFRFHGCKAVRHDDHIHIQL